MALGVSPERVREVRFAEQWRGYRTDEVDDFVEQVADAFDLLEARVRESASRASEAERRLLERGPDEDLSRTLILAQRTADAARREAEVEAARMLAEADAEARAMMEEAETRRRQLDQEIEARIASELYEVADRRAALQRDVAALTSFVEHERRRLAAELRGQLSWLERPGHLDAHPAPIVSAWEQVEATLAATPHAAVSDDGPWSEGEVAIPVDRSPTASDHRLSEGRVSPERMEPLSPPSAGAMSEEGVDELPGDPGVLQVDDLADDDLADDDLADDDLADDDLADDDLAGDELAGDELGDNDLAGDETERDLRNAGAAEHAGAGPSGDEAGNLSGNEIDGSGSPSDSDAGVSETVADRVDDDTALDDLDIPWRGSDVGESGTQPATIPTAGKAEVEPHPVSRPRASDDPFLAELRRAVDDPEPLGPRDAEDPDVWADQPGLYEQEKSGTRFRRRRQR